jgi:hypothetical protein
VRGWGGGYGVTGWAGGRTLLRWAMGQAHVAMPLQHFCVTRPATAYQEVGAQALDQAGGQRGRGARGAVRRGGRQQPARSRPLPARSKVWGCAITSVVFAWASEGLACVLQVPVHVSDLTQTQPMQRQEAGALRLSCRPPHEQLQQRKCAAAQRRRQPRAWRRVGGVDDLWRHGRKGRSIVSYDTHGIPATDPVQSSPLNRGASTPSSIRKPCAKETTALPPYRPSSRPRRSSSAAAASRASRHASASPCRCHSAPRSAPCSKRPAARTADSTPPDSLTPAAALRRHLHPRRPRAPRQHPHEERRPAGRGGCGLAAARLETPARMAGRACRYGSGCLGASSPRQGRPFVPDR